MNKIQKIALTTPSGFLAFGFGSGLAPVAPGTFGTLMAIPLYMALQTLPPLLYLAIVLAAFIGGVWICGRAGEALGVHDHGGIVWDEFVGFWITMWLVPFDWIWLLAGFILFRFFDIIKPFPIGWIDKKVSGGFGVMIDDVLAGFYAWIVLMVAGYLI